MTGRLPYLADAADLITWADRITARSQFPTLLRRLIAQTNDQVFRLEMRDDEGTDAAGYDGRVEAGRATPLVPLGQSVWELGVGQDPREKANADYESRTRNPLDVNPAKTTFVFATPRRWAGKEQWAAAKRAEGKWADVQVYDADNVSIALESATAAHYWFSELVDKPASGIQTVEDWWERFSTLTTPTLTPALVLAGRADDAAVLLRLLEADTGISTIAAPSADDVLAFVAATLHGAPESSRGDFLSRTLIVRDQLSLRLLDRAAKLLILLPFEDELRRDADLVRNNHVIYRAPEGSEPDIKLRPIDRDAFLAELSKEGVERDRATQLAAAAYRSIVAFRNEAPARGRTRRSWGKPIATLVARRALLVGAWNEARSGDVSELEVLFNSNYAAALDALRPLTRGEDPMFTAVGPAWTLVSPKDAWRFGAAKIESIDLAALEVTIQSSLGAIDPALELAVADRWRAPIYGKVSVYSSNLRIGLARTLALAGTDSSTVPAGSTATVGDWAGAVVGRLLGRANDHPSGELWQSLDDVLPLFAEAAPDVFLAAVDAGLAGDDPVLKKMFTDMDEGLFNTSPHTGLLWALEVTAWSPEHAARSASALARLAEIDPGGKLSNRPARSLGGIFRPWLPQTSLPLERRMKVLDALRRDHPKVAWDLMIELLPTGRDVGMYGRTPEYRDWKAGSSDEIAPDYAECVTAVAQRLVDTARSDPDRWPHLIPHLPNLPTAQREAAMELLTLLSDETR